MTRTELHRLASARRKEAKQLLDHGHYLGAYYLVGYAVECALKACIAKGTKKHDFPDKQLAVKAFTHNLEDLMRLSGVGAEFEKDLKTNPKLSVNWAVVKDWSEQSRYRLDVTSVKASDLYSACTRHNDGVLTWLRKRW